MNYSIKLLLVIFFSTYFLSSISLLHTESFVLFLSFSTVFLLLINNTNLKISFSKEEFKWNETIQFFVIMKNWNRVSIRLIDLKICKFVNLVLQLQKYQIEWITRNFAKLQKRDSLYLKNLQQRRLEILEQRRKSSVFFFSGLQSLPISELSY